MAPKVPADAQSKSAEGASAFARHYLDAVNDAFAAQDATTLRILSDPACASCQRLIDAVERPPVPGETVEGGDYEIAHVVSTLDAPEIAFVLVDYGTTPVRVLDAAGAVIRQRPASPPAPATMQLTFGPDAWTVTSFTNVEP